MQYLPAIVAIAVAIIMGIARPDAVRGRVGVGAAVAAFVAVALLSRILEPNLAINLASGVVAAAVVALPSAVARIRPTA
jgi:hypothetical protein